MAFSANLTLDDASGDDVVYSLIKTNGDGTTRIDTASTLALPGQMSIKHSVTGKGPSAVDRHLVQFSRTVSASPADVQVVANFTLAVPRNVAVTQEILFDMLYNMYDFLLDGSAPAQTSGANVIALLRGES